MHFDLADLRLFLNTTDTGSITAGAARSHLSLASASARLRGLEASLGAALWTRGRRGVQPTAAGQALAYHARSLLRHVDRMQEDLGDYASGFKGRVRLLCNTAAVTEHLPEPLGTFLRAHPNIDIDLHEQPSHRILPELREGTADPGRRAGHHAGIGRPAVDRTGGPRLLILGERWADRQLMLCARTLEGLPNYARALIDALQRQV